MANISDAVDWVRAGKKIRLPFWAEKSYVFTDSDDNYFFKGSWDTDSPAEPYRFWPSDVFSTEWELIE